VGAHPHGAARAHAATAGTRGDPQRGDGGQAKRQDPSQGGLRGDDAHQQHQQVQGRTRHLLVDTQGLLRKVVVSAAAGQDRDGARPLAHAVRLYGPHWPRLSVVWADAADAGQLVEDRRQLVGWQVAVVKRSDPQPRSACAVQPHRWIVESTFGWFGGFPRLSKDDE
jgi:putative transposase